MSKIKLSRKIQDQMLLKHERAMEKSKAYNDTYDNVLNQIRKIDNLLTAQQSNNLVDSICELSLFVETFFFKKGLNDGMELILNHSLESDESEV